MLCLIYIYTCMVYFLIIYFNQKGPRISCPRCVSKLLRLKVNEMIKENTYWISALLLSYLNGQAEEGVYKRVKRWD